MLSIGQYRAKKQLSFTYDIICRIKGSTITLYAKPVWTGSILKEVFMRLEIFDYDSGEEISPPLIIWEEDERYAIIAFLLLSIDGKMSDEDMKKFEAYSSFSQMEEVKDNLISRSLRWIIPGGYRGIVRDPGTVRDTIIREGRAFLDSLDHEERYDCIIDEIDRIIERNDKCGIGNGYDSNIKLPGTADIFLDFVKLIYSDNGYSKNQQRFLEHLARKWDIDKSVLPILETSLKSLDEINRKRIEIENSDMLHREAVSVLAELDAREKAVREKLNKLIIEEEGITDKISDCIAGGMHFASGLKRLFQSEEFNALAAAAGYKEKDDDEEETVVDKIGNGIVEGIYKVGDIICAPFDWMTEKVSGW